MTTKSTLFLVFGGVFGLMALVVGATILYAFVSIFMPSTVTAVEQNLKRSAETSGTIISVSQYRSSGDKYRGSTINSTYGYQYVVNGTTYSAEQMKGGRDGDEKKKGLEVKVCFDPSDPRSSAFYDLQDRKICGQTGQ